MSAKLDRIVQMDALIRGGRYPSVAVFRARFEVGERTVHDDLDFMRNRLGAPLKYDRRRGGYSYTDSAWSLPTVWVGEGEALAFFLSVELTRRYLGTSFEEPLRRTMEQLAQWMPEQVRLDLGQLVQHYTFQAGATASVDPLVLVALLEAIHERWPVEMVYFTKGRGERNRRVIEPYHLYNVRGDWQVIAFDHLRQQQRNFAVNSIEEWTVLKGERFSLKSNFSLEKYLGQGFLAEHGDAVVEVVVWFDAYQARYERGRRWHETQEMEEHADGSLTVRFRTGALGEVQRWVLGFGRHAEVMAPAQLRCEVMEEVAAMAAQYGGAGKSEEI